MASAAYAIEPTDVREFPGTVVGTSVGAVQVRTLAGVLETRRAVSCLVEPRMGDRVLVAMGTGVCHVLAVLEREAGTGVTLSADGDINLQVLEGKVSVVAAHGVEIVTPGIVSVGADVLNVVSREGKLSVGVLEYVGLRVGAEIERARVYAERLDTVADRWVQRAKNLFRTVDELEHSRVGTLDVTARGTITQHAENQVVTAEKLVKFDGEQIHMG